MSKLDDYQDLNETGYEAPEVKSPEEELFHSIYISGVPRKNHKDIVEQVGKLQIRGVDYNLDEVYGIITHIKTVLVKTTTVNKRDTVECFCYQAEKPWKGTSGRMCGATSVIRSADPYCSQCKSNLIVSFLLCQSNGKPLTDEKGNKLFGFVRGKGMKYMPLSNYLSELSSLDIPALYPGEKNEKAIVNHKRFVTKITVGTASSNFGPKTVFDFTKTIEIPKNYVEAILDVAKKTLSDFNEKFDWSKNKLENQESQSNPSPSNLTTFDLNETSSPKNDNATSDAFDFEDIVL